MSTYYPSSNYTYPSGAGYGYSTDPSQQSTASGYSSPTFGSSSSSSSAPTPSQVMAMSDPSLVSSSSAGYNPNLPSSLATNGPSLNQQALGAQSAQQTFQSTQPPPSSGGIGGFFKDLGNSIKNMFTSLADPKNLLMAAAGIALCIFVPEAAPILMAAGMVMGGGKMLSGITSGNMQETTDGLLDFGLSALGTSGGDMAAADGSVFSTAGADTMAAKATLDTKSAEYYSGLNNVGTTDRTSITSTEGDISTTTQDINTAEGNVATLEKYANTDAGSKALLAAKEKLNTLKEEQAQLETKQADLQKKIDTTNQTAVLNPHFNQLDAAERGEYQITANGATDGAADGTTTGAADGTTNTSADLQAQQSELDKVNTAHAEVSEKIKTAQDNLKNEKGVLNDPVVESKLGQLESAQERLKTAQEKKTAAGNNPSDAQIAELKSAQAAFDSAKTELDKGIQISAKTKLKTEIKNKTDLATKLAGHKKDLAKLLSDNKLADKHASMVKAQEDWEKSANTWAKHSVEMMSKSEKEALLTRYNAKDISPTNAETSAKNEMIAYKSQDRAAAEARAGIAAKTKTLNEAKAKSGDNTAAIENAEKELEAAKTKMASTGDQQKLADVYQKLRIQHIKAESSGKMAGVWQFGKQAMTPKLMETGKKVLNKNMADPITGQVRSLYSRTPKDTMLGISTSGEKVGMWQGIKNKFSNSTTEAKTETSTKNSGTAWEDAVKSGQEDYKSITNLSDANKALKSAQADALQVLEDTKSQTGAAVEKQQMEAWAKVEAAQAQVAKLGPKKTFFQKLSPFDAHNRQQYLFPGFAGGIGVGQLINGSASSASSSSSSSGGNPYLGVVAANEGSSDASADPGTDTSASGA